MSSVFAKLYPGFTAFTRWAEHPNTVNYIQNKVALPLGAAGMAALTLRDYKQAPADERKKVLIRNGLVLGSTAVGTLVAARGLGFIGLGNTLKKMGLNTKQGIGSTLKNGLMSFDKPHHMEHLAEFLDDALIVLEKNKYSQHVKAKLQAIGNSAESLQSLNPGKSYRELFAAMKAELQKKQGVKDVQKTLNKHIGKMFPEPMEGHSHGLEEALRFFTVGAISVLSGLAGGLLANKVNGNKDPNATVNMVKEGIFQFVANIALCAVGAGLALSLVNGKWGVKSLGLEKAAEKFKNTVGRNKLARTGIIGAGLSLGIFGGGQFANWAGQNYINPFFDKLQGKTPPAGGAAQPKKVEKRDIEFADAMLHLDDVPTAMALAGVEIVEPFIPLFFAFSGYRTGIGYRNDGHGHSHGHGKGKPSESGKIAPHQPAGFLMPANHTHAHQLPPAQSPYGALPMHGGVQQNFQSPFGGSKLDGSTRSSNGAHPLMLAQHQHFGHQRKAVQAPQ